MKKIIKKPVEEMTPLEMWSIFIECVDDSKYRNVVNKIIQAKEEIQMARAVLDDLIYTAVTITP